MKTEVVTFALRTEAINGKRMHCIQPGREILQLLSFFVPDRDPAAVGVLGLYTYPAQRNMLHDPVDLVDLNTWLLQVQLLPIGVGSCAYVHLEDAHLPLQARAVCRIETPYWHGDLDRAYRGWREENPHGSIAMWQQFTGERVAEGRLLCEINRCDDPALVGSLRCAAHQEKP